MDEFDEVQEKKKKTTTYVGDVIIHPDNKEEDMKSETLDDEVHKLNLSNPF